MLPGERVRVGVLLGVAMALLTGCELLAPKDDSDRDRNAQAQVRAVSCGDDSKPEQNVKLDLIRQLMDSGKLYAALAHLDETHSSSLQAAYLRAEILRRTDHADKAETFYRKLLKSCLAGRGYHGLGLIAGRKQRINEAIYYLQKAADELPVDLRVRNDLGYALLLGGRFDSAREEFLTVLELDGGDRLAASNMILLLSMMGKEQELRVFSEHLRMDAETVAQLQLQAEGIKASLGAVKSSSSEDE
ncbi:MAG: hypothetical protein IBX56_02805 [Methylomicrobium sp.]|nr:hypothetical protein [Methylomicrobium sp.]